MLAEPKYKLKWAEDPRNINWSKDTNKYGYKMLSKMGWSEGKGLGSNENGTTSHVKVSKRKENLGLGASTNNEDNWLSHQDEFSALLSKLNQKDSRGGDGQQSSLQENVQSSQRKILYSKFIKSKDLSLKSKNDLACIFGQRSKSAPSSPQGHSEDEDSKPGVNIAQASVSTGECNNSFVTVKSEMNLQEYFASKMAALRQKSEVKDNGVLLTMKKEVEETRGETEEREKVMTDSSFKLGCSEIGLFESNEGKKLKKVKTEIQDDQKVVEKVKPKKKSKKNKKKVDSDYEEQTVAKMKDKTNKKKVNIDEDRPADVERAVVQNRKNANVGGEEQADIEKKDRKNSKNGDINEELEVDVEREDKKNKKQVYIEGQMNTERKMKKSRKNASSNEEKQVDAEGNNKKRRKKKRKLLSIEEVEAEKNIAGEKVTVFEQKVMDINDELLDEKGKIRPKKSKKKRKHRNDLMLDVEKKGSNRKNMNFNAQNDDRINNITETHGYVNGYEPQKKKSKKLQ